MSEQKQNEVALKVEREMVMDLETGQIRPSVAQAPLLSSAALGWHGLLVERHRLGAFAAENILPAQQRAFFAA